MSKFNLDGMDGEEGSRKGARGIDATKRSSSIRDNEERETGMACRGMDDEEEGMRGKWGFTSKKCEKSPKYAIK